MLSILNRRILLSFAKWSKPKPKPSREREQKKSFAVSDDKAAKLSKSEQQLENKQKFLEASRIQEETERKLALFKKHDRSLEEYMSKQEQQNIYVKQLLYLKGVNRKKEKVTEKNFMIEDPNNRGYLPTELTVQKQGKEEYKRVSPQFGNYTKVVNSKFAVQQFEGDPKLRRVGALGVKLGMTTLWDRWGRVVPATIIELDRTQVVQIKKPVRHNEWFQVQVGVGSRKLKKVSKPLLGHYIKARVPPKQKLVEFKVSEECLLPVGYMITARHYTPGMYVDVLGKTVGHGFQGTIKRWGFKRQPQTHGNSLTTRVLGSTGGRQDPGRVFKQKKMYGRMGGKMDTQCGLPVFKIDVDKNLLYIRGTIPGKAGSIVRIRDSMIPAKSEQNQKLCHYPTFVEAEGEQYAREMTMYCGQRDPNEIEIHDNAYIVDDNEEAATETPKDTLPED